MNDFDAIIQNAFANGADPAEVFQAIADEADKEQAAKPVQLKKTGLTFTGNALDAQGRMISSYAFTYEGKHLFTALVDNDAQIDAPAGLKAPEGATLHPISITKADGSQTLTTGGLAAKMAHQDGSGVHIDGQTVAGYVIPRAMRFVIALYAA